MQKYFNDFSHCVSSAFHSLVIQPFTGLLETFSCFFAPILFLFPKKKMLPSQITHQAVCFCSPLPPPPHPPAFTHFSRPKLIPYIFSIRRRTKRKKIFVISTLKRPVPLEHHLFTGNSTKTINELFLLIESHGKFDKRGYQAAVAAKKSRAAKAKDAYGPKGGKQGNPKQVRTGEKIRVCINREPYVRIVFLNGEAKVMVPGNAVPRMLTISYWNQNFYYGI